MRNRGVVLLLWSCWATTVWAQYAPCRPEWNRPVEPFRIVGNIHYVGASDVSAFLITTPEGHILLDTGFQETVPLLEAGVKKLGFRMDDIRLLLASHAHFDHAGGLAAVRSRTRARLSVNPAEVELFVRGGKGDFAFGDAAAFPPVKPDGLLGDGGAIRLGGVVLTAHFTPGHTKGCTSYSMTVREGQESYRVVFTGSVSAPGYQLADNPKYPDIVQDFEATFARLRALPCEVFLGGHSWDFGLADKLKARASRGGRNPFIDPAGYRNWVAKAEAAFRRQLDEQRRR